MSSRGPITYRRSRLIIESVFQEAGGLLWKSSALCRERTTGELAPSRPSSRMVPSFGELCKCIVLRDYKLRYTTKEIL